MADSAGRVRRDDLYAEAAAEFGAALERLARGYEADADRRRDLLQEIHLQLWRSLERFDGRCSLRTWVYRVAHNAATSLVLRKRLRSPVLISLDELASMPASADVQGDADRLHTLEKLMAIIRALRPIDRQVMLLYLEGMTADAIGEVVGLSAGNVATKVHRVKQFLASRFEGQR